MGMCPGCSVNSLARSLAIITRCLQLQYELAADRDCMHIDMSPGAVQGVCTRERWGYQRRLEVRMFFMPYISAILGMVPTITRFAPLIPIYVFSVHLSPILYVPVHAVRIHGKSSTLGPTTPLGRRRAPLLHQTIHHRSTFCLPA